VASALTEYMGLYPTLAELAGLAPPTETTVVDMPHAPRRLDAASFADVVRDPDLEGPPAVYSEYNLRAPDPRYMIRTRRYKYILNQGVMDELYGLEADPGEYVNRIDDPALRAVQGELRECLLTWYDPESNPYRL